MLSHSPRARSAQIAAQGLMDRFRGDTTWLCYAVTRPHLNQRGELLKACTDKRRGCLAPLGDLHYALNISVSAASIFFSRLGSRHCGEGLALTPSLVFTEMPPPAYICQEQHSPSFRHCNTEVD